MFDRTSNHFVGWTIEHVLRRGVEQHDSLLVIYRDDRVHRRRDNGCQPTLAFANYLLGLFPLLHKNRENHERGRGEEQE